MAKSTRGDAVPMACPEALRLFDLYQEALSAFHAARLRFPDAGDYEGRFSMLAAARCAYWKHVEAHGCRTASVEAGSKNQEDRLREEMDRARIVFNQASEACDRPLELAVGVGQNIDSDLAQQQAILLRAEAAKRYTEAIRRFSDYVLRGKPRRSDRT